MLARRTPLATLVCLSLLALSAGSAQATLSQYPKTYGQVIQPMTNSNGSVNAIAVAPDNNTVYVAGDFTTFGGVARTNAAAFRLDTGALTSWNPNVSYMAGNAGLAVSEDGSTVFIAGGFNTVGGVSRPSIAAVNSTTGALVSAFNASIPPCCGAGSGWAQALAVSGSTLYMGGSFTSVGGQTRNKLAAVSTSTGAVQSWNPNVSSGNQIDSMKKVGNSNFVVSGNINTIAGVSRTNIAEIDSSGAAVTSFNANANQFSISDVDVSGTNVFAAGNFTTFGGQSLNRLAQVDATGAALSSWAPDPNSQPNALAMYGTSGVAVGGGFATIGGAVRDKLAMINSAGAATSWNPNPNQSVSALATVGTTVIAGGSFSTLGFGGFRSLRNGVAVFEDIVPPGVGDGQPSIAGTAAVNGILGCTPPSVTNNDPLGYTTSYTWLRDSDPNGATDNAYTVTAADAGKTLYCKTTFTNAAGSTSTTSAAVTIPENASGGATGGDSTTAVVPRVRMRLLSNLGQVLRNRKLTLKVGCNTSLTTSITLFTTGIRQIRLATKNVSCDGAGSQEVVANVRNSALAAVRRAVDRGDLRRVDVRVVARVTGGELSRTHGVLRF